MAYISQDPNQNQEANTTNVLAPTATSTLPAPTPPENTTAPVSTSAPSAGYVSNGNPYGKYGTPTGPQAPAGTSASNRKTNAGPSSGLQTNVQTYAEKNKASSQGLGSAVAGKLQTSSDIAKQNLANVEKKFGQAIDVGSLENRQGAVQEAQTAFTEAATAAGPERTFKENTASLYMPTKTAEGAYSAEDQALVDANKAKVVYGDGSTKEFADAATAQADVDTYNRLNPGYNTYGQDETFNKSKDRLSEILNAKYQGPQELSEISGFGDASNKIQDVSTLQKQALGGGTKEELLKRTFETQTGEYGKGARLLDDLLLGQGKAAETLKSTAETLGAGPTGKIGDEFTSRVKDARMQAAQRSTEIDQVKNEARKALTETSAGRSKEVNQRIEGVIKDWDKYPNYFKERFKNELETHNVSSAKKGEYDSVVSRYGTPEQLQSRKQNLESSYGKLRDVDTDLLNESAKIVDNYNNILEASNSSNRDIAILYKGKLPQLEEQYKLAKTQVDNVKSLLPKEEVTMLDQGPLTSVDLVKKIAGFKNEMNTVDQGLTALQPLQEFRNYDPNALDVKLSQLEAESLGVQGGEGLYNILKEQGVEGLIKTAAYDKNKLIGTDEQAQLARLQSMAELAKDYGVAGSGVNVVNQFGDRDLAGQQNATSALDIDNFKRLMQGAERTFRTDAAASNISGTGTGSGSSRGLFGKKKATATQSVSQNFGDLLAQNNAYRNMYSDKGVNKDLLKTASDLAKGEQTFASNVDSTNNLAGQTSNIYNQANDMMGKVIGKGQDAVNNLLGDTLGGLAGAPTLGMLNLTNKFTGAVSNALGGSSAAASGEANRNAYNAAVANLQANIQNKIQSTGLKNQLSVNRNQQQDAELFKLLGLLDTTNL
jgi:hypothetical protein